MIKVSTIFFTKKCGNWGIYLAEIMNGVAQTGGDRMFKHVHVGEMEFEVSLKDICMCVYQTHISIVLLHLLVYRLHIALLD